MSAVTEEIEQLSARRIELWATGEDPEEVARITTRLTELWHESRVRVARQQFGDPDTIIRRARIESELERLMSD